jgi:hypothetical protein
MTCYICADNIPSFDWAIVVVAIVFGGLWRRAFGGWLGMSRVMLTVASVIVASALAWVSYGIDWRVGVVAAGWAWLWSDGHEFDPPGKTLLYRYLAPSATMAVLVGNPWLVLIGLGIFAAYWTAWRLWPTWRSGDFVDGVYAYAEIGAGAVAFGVLALVLCK